MNSKKEELRWNILYYVGAALIPVVYLPVAVILKSVPKKRKRRW